MRKPKRTHGGRRPNQTGRPPKPPSDKRVYRLIGFSAVNLDWLHSQAASTGRSMAAILNTLLDTARGA